MLAARFVRFSFELDVWVFIGQLEVYGTKVLQRAARPLKPTRPRRKKERRVDRWLMPEDFMGIRELLLAYNCHPGREDQGRWTVEQFLPYVGYYDRGGRLCDYFFDAYLFLPFAAFPMRVPACNADLWRMYVDNTFADRLTTPTRWISLSVRPSAGWATRRTGGRRCSSPSSIRSKSRRSSATCAATATSLICPS